MSSKDGALLVTLAAGVVRFQWVGENVDNVDEGKQANRARGATAGANASECAGRPGRGSLSGGAVTGWLPRVGHSRAIGLVFMKARIQKKKKNYIYIYI